MMKRLSVDSYTRLSAMEGDYDLNRLVVDVLASDGLVDVLPIEIPGGPNVKLSDKGKAFIAQGGYASDVKKARRLFTIALGAWLKDFLASRAGRIAMLLIVGTIAAVISIFAR